MPHMQPQQCPDGESCCGDCDLPTATCSTEDICCLSCECIDPVTRQCVPAPDISVSFGGTTTPLPFFLDRSASGLPPLTCPAPASCPTSWAQTFSVPCGGGDASIGFNGADIVFACSGGGSLVYWYHIETSVVYTSRESSGGVILTVRSGYVRSFSTLATATFFPIQSFQDTFTWDTKLCLSSPPALTRTWIEGESASENCCRINGVTTSVSYI